MGTRRSLALSLLAGSVAVGLSAPAAAYEHKDEVTTYAAIVAVLHVASDCCPDIVGLDVAPADLQAKWHIVPADQMAVQLEIRGLVAALRENADKYGKAWCDQQMERFGPDGTLMRGLLKRE